MEPVNQHLDPFVPIYWNVAFIPADENRWWHFFTKHWCRHVLAWGFVQRTQSWIVINPQENRTILTAIPDSQFDEYLEVILSNKATVLQIRSGSIPYYKQRILQTCSTVVARVIGINGPALTPSMLYGQLIAKNATVKTDPFNVYKIRSS